MKVLVTGGAGFIGSHVVEALVEAGCEVRVLDLTVDPAGRERTAADLHPLANYVWGDIRDTDTVDRACGGIDAVSHHAAKVGLETGMADVSDYVAHNDLGTAVLLGGLDRAAFSGRLVLASSMVVYGEGRYRCVDHGVIRPAPRPPDRLAAGMFDPQCPTCGQTLGVETIDEDVALDPRNVYAATKVHQEHLFGVFGRQRDLPVTALRYHNVYGPRMPRDTPYAGVAAIFRSALERGDAPQVFEDGRQQRDFVHVADVARANLAALTADRPAPGAFNVASGTAHTVGEMAEALADAFGPSAPRPQVTGAFRLGDVRHILASPDRARSVLGFAAQTDFAQGMSEFATAPLR
ncbi:MAG TPA: NAD-dependent epimerase/dehydratase family protein [Acidimicrobiales bacterium]|nr:NAD-dependent epimerase/dehydratase family protein [Acidimicrobiales bacterium]